MQSLIHIWKRRQLAISIVVVAFFLLLLMLSQISLQFRHKTIIMPLFYIIVAYGFYNKAKLGKILGISGAILLIFVQLIVNVIAHVL